MLVYRKLTNVRVRVRFVILAGLQNGKNKLQKCEEVD